MYNSFGRKRAWRKEALKLHLAVGKTTQVFKNGETKLDILNQLRLRTYELYKLLKGIHPTAVVGFTKTYFGKKSFEGVNE